MAKKKKQPGRGKLACGSFTTFKQDFSFDPESITFMVLLEYTIREEIQRVALAMSEDKMCIPKATIVAAIKQLGLGDWISKMPKDND